MPPNAGVKARMLPAIVVGQRLAASTWFAANAVIGVLRVTWGMAGGSPVTE